MYRWYQDAEVCYVYLPDVHLRFQNSAAFVGNFKGSRWFTRGWTLQELIAPLSVEFYNRDWETLGSKWDLVDLVHEATNIRKGVLMGREVPSACSVAERMGWAALRVTTREEDTAYCLLGIFGVNMPMLYGEGTRAFFRLQEEILRYEEDYSIFAWGLVDGHHDDHHAGMLARSPADFGPRFSIPYYYQGRATSPRVKCHGRCPWSDMVSVAPTKAKFYASKVRIFILPSILAEPFEPPSLTSRGLKLRLMAKELLDGTFLAWTFCIHSDGHSIVVAKLNDHRGKTALWRSPGPLELRPARELVQYAARDFHLPVRWKEVPLVKRTPLLRLVNVLPQLLARTTVLLVGAMAKAADSTEDEEADSDDDMIVPSEYEGGMEVVDVWPETASIIKGQRDDHKIIQIQPNQVLETDEAVQTETACVQAVIEARYMFRRAPVRFAVIVGSSDGRPWCKIPHGVGDYLLGLGEYFAMWEQRLRQDGYVRHDLDARSRLQRSSPALQSLPDQAMWLEASVRQRGPDVALAISLVQKRR